MLAAYLTAIGWKALASALLMNGLASLIGRYWRPIAIPRKVVFWGSIAIVFLAGFQAWREEHQSLVSTQEQLTRLVQEQLAAAKAESGRAALAIADKGPRQLVEEHKRDPQHATRYLGKWLPLSVEVREIPSMNARDGSFNISASVEGVNLSMNFLPSPMTKERAEMLIDGSVIDDSVCQLSAFGPDPDYLQVNNCQFGAQKTATPTATLTNVPTATPRP